SATQRHPLAVADPAAPRERRSSAGWDSPHSSSSVSSTPSALASARTASSSAAVPLVHAPYAILTVEADQVLPFMTRASSAVPSNSSRTVPAAGPDRYRRGLPAVTGGGPMIPPSKQVAPPSSPMSPTSPGGAGGGA